MVECVRLVTKWLWVRILLLSLKLFLVYDSVSYPLEFTKLSQFIPTDEIETSSDGNEGFY